MLFNYYNSIKNNFQFKQIKTNILEFLILTRYSFLILIRVHVYLCRHKDTHIKLDTYKSSNQRQKSGNGQEKKPMTVRLTVITESQ